LKIKTVENRFITIDNYLKRPSGKHKAAYSGKSSYRFARPFSAQNRVLVILIENGGVDLGIPEMIDKIFSSLPGLSIIPDEYRKRLVAFIREQLLSLTDNLLEGLELTAGRYTSSKPEIFSDVIILRNSTASYNELKTTLINYSKEQKIIDLFIMTHGSDDYISVTGGINSQRIRAIKSEFGRPLTIRSVYMMNCVGSSLNQAWLDAGAKVTSGTIRNNYLPEPTMFFFWNNWKDGQPFENAITSAFRKSINAINSAIRNFISSIPIPGTSLLASQFDIANCDFVRDSAPVIQGQRLLTINSDDINFSQSMTNSLATTVLPVRDLARMVISKSFLNERSKSWGISQQCIDLIKSFEGFVPKLYNDPAGHCTIGYGTLVHLGNCNSDPSERPFAKGITEQDAAQLLRNKVDEFQRIINDSVTTELNQNQYDSLVSFVYNIGGEKFKLSTLLQLLNKGNYGMVPGELKKWTKARVNGELKDLPGLVKRRNAEADLFQKPVTAASQSIPYTYRSFSAIDYTIPGIISPLRQPTGMVCWATVAAMMISWKKDQSVTIESALSSIGNNYREKFLRNEGLSSAEKATFLKDAGFTFEYPQSLTIEGWERLLRDYGPIWVTTDEDPSIQFAIHARIISAIKGDGTSQGTLMTITDPAYGSQYSEKFGDFLTKYEQEVRDSGANWSGRIQIVHWP
jgi:GH24 family phage-related lysozyme (muramidase)